MAPLKIYQFGAEVLQKPAQAVSRHELQTGKFRQFVNDMLETMYQNQGVGLAAPQVGVSKKVVTIDVNWANDKPKPLILINPKIISSDGQIFSEEGCLSFRGSTASGNGVQLKTVRRYQTVKVSYLDLNGRKCSIEASGDLLSRCLQHEIDHLAGVVFLERVADPNEVREQLQQNGFEAEYMAWESALTKSDE